jgi:hypothetical protein
MLLEKALDKASGFWPNQCLLFLGEGFLWHKLINLQKIYKKEPYTNRIMSGPGEKQLDQKAAGPASAIERSIKSWKNENDVKKGIPQLSQRLDALSRKGSGKNLSDLYSTVSRSLTLLENKLDADNKDLHNAIWKSVGGKAREIFTGTFLSLPMIDNAPLKSSGPFARNHRYITTRLKIKELLEHIGTKGARFKRISAHIKKNFLDKNLSKTKEQQFFEQMRKLYISPMKKAIPKIRMPTPKRVR